jgi:hypothetical protein
LFNLVEIFSPADAMHGIHAMGLKPLILQVLRQFHRDDGTFGFHSQNHSTGMQPG